jgi:hypothetical protein
MPTMNEGINASRVIDARNFNGLGWREMLVMAALAGAGLWYFHNQQPAQTTNAPPPPPFSDSVPLEDREYQIIHRDADGNIIDVKPWPPTGSDQP